MQLLHKPEGESHEAHFDGHFKQNLKEEEET
jgi:hypothetical protein